MSVPAKEAKTLLELRNITKAYPGVLANNAVSLDVRTGEVRALLGENGAGKSTLIKIVMGIVQRDGGSIVLDGESIHVANARDAQNRGIHAVFQELSQIETLTVAENIYLTGESVWMGQFLNRKQMFARAQELLDYHTIEVDAHTRIESLPIAKRQLVEIIKATARDSKVLILDEPTSTLTDAESEILFSIIDHLKERGTGIIYITHRLNEVRRVADSVSVLRDGKNVAELKSDEIDIDAIVRHMVGREIDLHAHLSHGPVDYSREPLLRVEGIGRTGVEQGVSFELYRGEILGIAGLVGSGRSELMRLVYGIDTAERGTIRIDGVAVTIRSVRDALGNGIAMIPENRHTQGLNLGHSIATNIALPLLDRFVRFGLLVRRRLSEWVDRWIRELEIKTDTRDKLALYLSGGNQQKVVIAKWLSTQPRILIVDEPTAGIDVGSKSEIHRRIRELADQGLAIILISSDMPELLAMSDRILVMNRDRIVSSLPGNTTQEEIMSVIVKDNMGEKE